MDREQLKSQLLAEFSDEESETDDEQIKYGECEENIAENILREKPMELQKIRGFRDNTYVFWSADTETLYYKNSSCKDGFIACTCVVKQCTDRCYIEEKTGKAFKHRSTHTVNHGSMYEIYKHMECFNKMKDRCMTAPASMSPRDIYNEIVLE